MPDFGSPFSGLANDRKLTDEELIRAIRFMVTSEYEATQLYMQLAESTNNKLAVAVLKEIADEELVHVGEFLRLLRELAPDEEKLYAKGAKEVEEKIGDKRYSDIYVIHASPKLIQNLKSQFGDEMDSIEMAGISPMWKIKPSLK